MEDKRPRMLRRSGKPRVLATIFPAFIRRTDQHEDIRCRRSFSGSGSCIRCSDAKLSKISLIFRYLAQPCLRKMVPIRAV